MLMQTVSPISLNRHFLGDATFFFATDFKQPFETQPFTSYILFLYPIKLSLFLFLFSFIIISSNFSS